MKKILEDNLQLLSMMVAIVIGYLIGLISVYGFEEYGWTVFVVIPFFLGMIPTLICGTQHEISIEKSLKIGFQTLVLFCATTLLFAIEGIICIIMASPIMILSTLLGASLGYFILKKWKAKTKQLYSFLLLPLVFLVIDISTNTTEYLEVKTAIEINAPIETVWTNVISFGQIAEPDEWIFKTGISYPTDAKIVGSGVGAIRYCNFTTGSFVEPITTWNEPTLLQFDVQDQPTPMRELNPFWDVHPPHLDGYFQSKKGQFVLKKLVNGKTLVEGTTWYNIHIHPVHYWDTWSKFILHEIHFRVLKHIKSKSEKLVETTVF